MPPTIISSRLCNTFIGARHIRHFSKVLQRSECAIINLSAKNLDRSDMQILGVSDLTLLQMSKHHTMTNYYCSMPVLCKRFASTKAQQDKSIETDTVENTEKPLAEKTEAATTQVSKLKKAITEYGTTVIVFHVAISLVSLGVFYVLVDSGLDVRALISKVGISDENVNKVASNAGTFVLAYAVHKVFAPVRIGITLTATPFIVRYLRKIGWLKIKT